MEQNDPRVLRQKLGPYPVDDRNNIVDYIKQSGAWAHDCSLCDATTAKVESYQGRIYRGTNGTGPPPQKQKKKLKRYKIKKQYVDSAILPVNTSAATMQDCQF